MSFRSTICKKVSTIFIIIIMFCAFQVLRRFVENCLSLADDRKFKTLAFPAIGTGRLQIPPDVVASCVKEVVEKYSSSHPQTSVEKLIFVIHEADTANFQVNLNFLNLINNSKNYLNTAFFYLVVTCIISQSY